MIYFYTAWLILAAATLGVAAVILVRRSLPKPFSVCGSRLVLPHSISADELGQIEGGLPGLKAINVVCHYIEDPAGKLANAVVRNLKAGVTYTFLISPSRATDEANGYYQIFQKYAELASPDTPTEQLISIRRLDREWSGFPCIFYTLEIASKSLVIAYRGTQMNEGIADHYELMDGHETAGALTAALNNASSVEESLPAPKPINEHIKHTINPK